MHTAKRSVVLIAVAVFCILSGVLLVGAGGWLIALGGSWYYLACGLVLVAVSVLLYRRSRIALWLYALLVLATLVWSWWEVGLDWWPLAARGDVVFVLGLFLLLPPVVRALSEQPDPDQQDGAPIAPGGAGRLADARATGYGAAGFTLAGVLAVFLVVAVASWFVDLHQIEGRLAAAPAQPAGYSEDIPDGEWHAYGRTGYGQRYSPLSQITPENVSQLELAWHYETGDLPEKGDPTETTFEVTPLKIGDFLYLCTPHQSVIALDATTGKEVWRYDPKIQGKLALQHLTCRGLSYFSGEQGLSAHDATQTTSALPKNIETVAAQSKADAVGSASPSEAGVVAAGSVEADMAADERAMFSQPRDPAPPAPGQPVAARDGPVVEVCDTMLFMPTADGRIIALDPKSGAVCKAFGGGTGQINLWANMPNVNPGGYYSTSPVVVTDSLIIVGGTVLDNVSTSETSGVIRAFDVKTGGLVWNWDSGNPDETRPIAPDETYVANSPNSWSISSVDTRLGMVYVPMGNAPPDQWGAKRDDNTEHFSSSVVALDLKTGQVRWVFQTVHHDLWDYDVPAQPCLIDLNVNGKTVPVLVQPTKQGEVFVLNRATGKPLLPVTEQPAPQGAQKDDRVHPTQPVSALSFSPPPLTGASMWGVTMFDQLACRIAFHSLRYEGRFTPPSTQGSLIYPGNFGVFNWGGVAVDPQRQVVFATPTYLAFVSRLVPRQDDSTLYVQENGQPENSLPALNENFGAPYAVQLSPFTSPLGIPCQQPPWGYVAAADLTTGKVVWMHKNGTVRDSSPLPLPFRLGVPNLGGPIMTGAGLAFLSGTLDYYVRAYDVSTGQEVWKDRLPAGGQATPMTYQGKDGRQYLLVVAGGHGSLGTKAGDAVRAYALP